MCGRYTLSSTPDEVSRLFDVSVRDNFPARYNIAPTQAIAVIRAGERFEDREKRFYQLMRWGFIPAWAYKKTDAGHLSLDRPLINARSESVAVKPTFASAFKRRRCLIPANGFYEWTSERGEKQPWFIYPAENELFGFAGIWETYLDPGGGEMDSVAILTTSSGDDMTTLYKREPVVIAPENYQEWLSADERDGHRVMPMLKAADDGFWQWHRVLKDVGNVRHEGERLIKPSGQLGLF